VRKNCQWGIRECDKPAVAIFKYVSVRFVEENVPYCAEHYDSAARFYRKDAEERTSTAGASREILRQNML
jgi:hypothetical protein